MASQWTCLLAVLAPVAFGLLTLWLPRHWIEPRTLLATLGPAIAVHLANNAIAILIVSAPDNLNGLALFLIPFDLSDTQAARPWLMVDFMVMIVSWLVARIAIRR